MHGIHHSTRRDETNSNWSSLLSAWDYLHGTVLLGVLPRPLDAHVDAVRDRDDLGSVLRRRLKLGQRRAFRHVHAGAAPGQRGGQGHALGVVAGAGADHAAGELRAREVGHLVVGAAQLEGEHRLLVLAL